MEDKDGKASEKAKWNENEIYDFIEHIILHIQAARNEEQPADLTGVIFPGHMDFSQFDNDAPLPNICFHSAVFTENTNFNNTEFNGNANFYKTIFSGSADFRGATFNGTAYFRNTTFSRTANFKITTFNEAANFRFAAFNRTVNFRNSTFVKYANFSNAEFHSSANFSRTKFYRNAFFVGNTGDVTQPSNTFHYMDFRKREFNSDLIGYANFSNRRFLDKANYKSAVFYKAPKFHNAKLHQDTDFTGAKFLDTTSDHAGRAYRTLKLAMGEVRARKEEADFYALEQESLRKIPLTPKSVKVASWFYKYASDYGRSFTLPIFWFLALFVFFTAEYSLLANRHMPADLGNSVLFALDQVVRPFKALTFDYGGKMPGLLDDHPIIVRMLAAFQSLATIGLVTLFILAIRRRFKLS